MKYVQCIVSKTPRDVEILSETVETFQLTDRFNYDIMCLVAKR